MCLCVFFLSSNLTYIFSASDSNFRYLCWRVANRRLDEFRRQISVVSSVFTHLVSISDRLLNRDSYNRIILCPAKDANNIDFGTAAIGKVFHILIRNLQASLADLKNNSRRRSFVLNADLLQIEDIRYSDSSSYREYNFWYLSSKQREKKDLIYWYIYILISNICLYQHYIFNNINNGIGFVSEICAKTRRQ